jgi:hypothetical protein
MKSLFSLIGLLFSTIAFSQVDTAAYESNAKEVTIFFSGAQVSRSAKVTLRKGKNVFKLDKLPTDINPQSIQVQGVDGGKILSVKHDIITPDTTTKSKEELALMKRIDHNNYLLTTIKSKVNVSELEEKLLMNNSIFTSSTYAPSIQEVKEAADAYKKRLNDLRTSRLKYSEEFDSINLVIKDMYFKINELRSKRQKPYSTILVAMECANDMKPELTFSYYIKSARWEPLYDFRVDDVSKPLTIIYNAKVYQTSGEDWKAVNVRLSANNPTIGGTKPELEEWILGQERKPVYSYDYQMNKSTNDYLKRKSGGTLRARIMDSETKEPIPFANIIMEQNGNQITGGTSDFDGICLIKPVPAGRFNVKTSFVGYQTMQINNVLIIEDQIRFLDVELILSTQKLNEIIIIDYYSRPITKDNTQSGGTITAEDFGRMQGRSREAVAATVGGVKRQKNEPKKAERKIISNATSRNNSVNLEYAIDLPYTIPTDGQDYTVKIKEVALPVDYVYHVVPKLEKDAFLMAEIEDWSELNLLAGKTSIYYQGTFTSESEIKAHQSEDTLKISLGRDKSVFVKREIRKELNDKKFFGNSVRETVGYDIVLRNNKNAKVKLIVEDQLPLSEKEAISVEHIDLAGATFEKNTGKLTWTVELEPNEKKTITYKYAVKYPRGSFIRLE